MLNQLCVSAPHMTTPRGHSPISDEEVVRLYRGTHIPLHQMNSFYGHPQEVCAYKNALHPLIAAPFHYSLLTPSSPPYPAPYPALLSQGGSMMHYLDMFSQPEVTLLADVLEVQTRGSSVCLYACVCAYACMCVCMYMCMCVC